MVDTVKASIVRAIADQWPGVTKIGGQRAPGDIANSSRESEHTYGNALDIFGTFEAMGTLAKYLDDNRGRFDIATLCYDPGPGRKYDRCTTKHTDHIHVSFSPKCYDLSTAGNGAERAARCNEKQGTGDMRDDDRDDTKEGTGGINLNPFAGVAESIENVRQDIGNFVRTGVFIGVGVALVGTGVYLAVRDTEAFKALQGAAKTAITKGAA